MWGSLDTQVYVLWPTVLPQRQISSTPAVPPSVCWRSSRNTGIRCFLSSNLVLNTAAVILSRAPSDKPYTCHKCGKVYAHQGSLWRHQCKCEGRLTLKCMFCDLLFHRKDNYRQHLLCRHHHQLCQHQYTDESLGTQGSQKPWFIFSRFLLTYGLCMCTWIKRKKNGGGLVLVLQ